MDVLGLLNYALYLATFICIYGCLAVGLNVQWGFAGLFNVGVAGFFAVGAYATAILTAPAIQGQLGGFALPVPVGIAGAMIASGLLAWPLGKLCLRFRGDYLAIVTIGTAEAIRLVARSEDWLTGSARGINGVPRPFGDLPYALSQLAYFGLCAAALFLAYLFIERLARSPWGRMMRAVRDNEAAATAMGKDVPGRHLQAFVLGAVIMGLGGALYAHLNRAMQPEAVDPMIASFLIWIMVVLGGSGNNRGVILGVIVVWTIWSASDFVTGLLPTDLALTGKYLRIFLIGLMLQLVLRYRPGGILPEPLTRPPPRREPPEAPEAPSAGAFP